MYAIELPVEIDANQQIHVQLPKNIQANKARIIVMYEDLSPVLAQSITLGLFAGKITMSDDFNEPLPDEFWLGDTKI
jgi:hypothetical protein